MGYEVRAPAYDGEVRPVRVEQPISWLPRYVVAGEVIWGDYRAHMRAQSIYGWRVEDWFNSRWS